MKSSLPKFDGQRINWPTFDSKVKTVARNSLATQYGLLPALLSSEALAKLKISSKMLVEPTQTEDMPFDKYKFEMTLYMAQEDAVMLFKQHLLDIAGTSTPPTGGGISYGWRKPKRHVCAHVEEIWSTYQI